MRHLAAVKVEATFDGQPPDVSRVPGVAAPEVVGNRLRCHVTGSIQPLLAVLASSWMRDLQSAEPSLEELFLSHYGTHA